MCENGMYVLYVYTYCNIEQLVLLLADRFDCFMFGGCYMPKPLVCNKCSTSTTYVQPQYELHVHIYTEKTF